MKLRKPLILTLLLFVMAAGVVYADSLWGYYKGYPQARVYMNNHSIDTGEGVPAFIINGSTVLPLRQVAEALKAIVKWDEDEKTAYIYKPNVSIFVAKDVSSKDYSVKQPFGKVDAGKTMDFVVFTQIDDLKTNVSGLKITILDPNGSVVESKEAPLDNPGDNFWYTWPFKVKFSETGNYKIQLAFEVDGSYETVAEKIIGSE